MDITKIINDQIEFEAQIIRDETPGANGKFGKRFPLVLAEARGIVIEKIIAALEANPQAAKAVHKALLDDYLTGLKK